MKHSLLARLALAAVIRLAHRNETLAGDLIEEFQRRRCGLWLAGQLLAALAMGAFRQPRAPVALNLTGIDPVVAEWLMDRELGSRRRINLTGTGVEGVGGLTLMMLGFLMSTVVPAMWWFVFGGIVAGVGLGTAKVISRRSRGLPHTHLILN
jgi:MFS family permease